jgi:uncharacterized protein (TIRG00374 family)
MKFGRRTGYLAQVVVSVGLLTWLLHLIDSEQVLQRFSNIRPGYAVGSAALLVLLAYPMTRRWQRVVLHLGVNLASWSALRLVLFNIFWSQTLPSFLLADALKAWSSRHTGLALREAMQAALLDRIAGAWTLACTCLIVLPVMTARTGISSFIIAGFFAVAVTAAGTVILLALTTSPDSWRRLQLVREIADVGRAVWTFLKDRAALGAVFAWSAASYALVVISIAILAAATGIQANLLDIALACPPVILIAMIPISYGGWGIREATMIVALAPLGISGEEALALSVLFGLALTVASATAGLLGSLVPTSTPAKP